LSTVKISYRWGLMLMYSIERGLLRRGHD
jgi:hypothetical protein